MSSPLDDSYHNANHIEKEKALLLNTIEVLDDEKENVLTEVLRCYVCLELPKGKQVRICEEGHHCCLTCHKKIKVCGICRGALLEGRNFVVEQLVTKLGPILGLQKNELPPAGPPHNLPSGFYQCPHQCCSKLPAFQMLPHLRASHSVNLLENVRSNPYFGCFSLKLNLHIAQDEKYAWSTHVSDMGLFTIVLDFFGLDFFGCVRMMAGEAVASLFRYQLTLKLASRESESSLEFSVTNCRVSSYLDDVESIRSRGNCLKITAAQLLEYSDIGSMVTVFVSIRERRAGLESKETAGPSLVCVPERPLHFENNRKARRNKNRNIRRSRIKLLRNSARSDDSARSLLEGLSHLSL